jgi:hypothetical protein
MQRRALALVSFVVACGGTAVVDPPDGDGGSTATGGSGGTITTVSSSSSGGAPSTTSVSSSATGPMPGCISCGLFLAGEGQLENVCGVVEVEEGVFAKCDGTAESCDIYADLINCACGSCGAECGGDLCMNVEVGVDCINCVTSVCVAEFNACAGDV